MTHIISHGYWRSCSTYLWSKARSSPGCTAYYEPFHEAFSGKVHQISSNSLDWNSRHPEINNYFSEIISAYNNLDVSMFHQLRGEWGHREYFLYSDSQRLHVAKLVLSFMANDSSSCYWGFNRGISKISAIHDSIFALCGSRPISLLVHREPSQQFGAIAYQSANGNPWFELRPYFLWLSGQLANDLASDEIAEIARQDQLTEDQVEETLLLMPARLELSAYLYSCSLLKSMLLSLGSWSLSVQESFVHDSCFLVDQFQDESERFRFESRLAQGGIYVNLDDFSLEAQRPAFNCDEFVIVLSCAYKAVMAKQPLEISELVVADYFNRLSDLDSAYARLSSCLRDVPHLTEAERSFMDKAKKQAEEFVLLADNKRLRARNASLEAENKVLTEVQSELQSMLASQEHCNNARIEELEKVKQAIFEEGQLVRKVVVERLRKIRAGA